MARKTRADAEQTRIALIEAALHCFSARGVTHTSLADVAAQAGVTRGAIYWHFKNKLDLFNAVHEQVELPFDYLLRRLNESTEPHSIESLRQLLKDVLLQAFNNQESHALLEILVKKCEFTDDLQPALERLIQLCQPLRPQLARVIAHLQQRGELIPDISAEHLSRATLCFLHGIIDAWLLAPSDIDLEAECDHFLEVFFRGIMTHPAHPSQKSA